MHHDRIRDLAEDLRTHVFELLDAEQDITGDEAGAVAATVEAAFLAKLHAINDTRDRRDSEEPVKNVVRSLFGLAK